MLLRKVYFGNQRESLDPTVVKWTEHEIKVRKASLAPRIDLVYIYFDVNII